MREENWEQNNHKVNLHIAIISKEKGNLRAIGRGLR
jgi:hypothetical protein